jgi:hypothetical protein
MKRKQSSKKRFDPAIIAAIITGATTILVAIISAIIGLTQTILPINATQTAEVRLTQVTPSLTHTTTPETPIASIEPTIISTSDCNYIDGTNNTFSNVLIEDTQLKQSLGSYKLSQPICLQGAYQAFDKGFMLWRADTVEIYVFFEQGNTWEIHRDTWTSGAPDLSCDGGLPPETPKPIRGFGKVWCEHESVRNGLGNVNSDLQDSPILLQSFDNGWMIIQNDTLYALIFNSTNNSTGTWKNIRKITPEYQKISLKEISDISLPEINLGLTPEVTHYFSQIPEIPFETGWKVSTVCSNFQNGRPTIQLNIKTSNVKNVYLLMQAGWGVWEYFGSEFGNVRMNFSDGNTLDTKLTLGLNIRDWSRKSEAVTAVSSSSVIPVWEGRAIITNEEFVSEEVTGGMDVLKIEIPDTYFYSTLQNIEISDISTTKIGNTNPCLHLLAVTIQHEP